MSGWELRAGERGRKALLAALLVTTSIVTGAVLPGPAAQAQQASKTVTYSVPAGPLGKALTVFGKQSGLQVTFLASVAAGKTSPGFSGPASRDQALAAILQGSGLTYSFPNATTVAISGSSDGAGGAATVPGAIALDTIDVSGGGSAAAAADAPYQTPGSSAYISSEQIERVPPTSSGDIFKTTPGVISAGNHNGASIDVNIRGLQGNNRVNVMVDGTQQSTSVYRGYGGHDSRVYVDPELIGGVAIEKGPSSGPYGAGAMGGVVNMRTIDAQDIVKEGRSVGARIKGSFGSNSLPPPDPTPVNKTDIPRIESTGLFENENFIGSAAFGAKTENIDLVAAFARRKNGNYSAGTKGDLTTELNGKTHVLSPYKYGDEVFNTSNDVTSSLAKGTFRFGEGHSVELGYIRYENTYGYVSPLTTQFSWRRQEPLSDTKTDTYTSKYKYNPESELIDFQANLWRADTQSNLPQTGLPQDTESKNWGFEAWNDFRVDTPVGALKIKLGASHSEEHSETSYETVGYILEYMEGNRELSSGFSEANLKVTDWLGLFGALRYDTYKLDGPIYDITRTSIGNGQFSSTMTHVGDKSDEGSRWNPTAGVTVTPWKEIQFFAQYSEGFRPPSVRESFLGLGNHNGIDILPNPNLKPEVAKNYEVGVNVIRENLLTDRDKFRTKIAYFDNTYEDYIVRMTGPLVGVKATDSWTNIDAAKFKGIEWSFDYDTGFLFASAGIDYYADIQYCAPPPAPKGAPSRCAEETTWRDYGSDYVPPEYMASLTLGSRWFDEKLTLGARATIFGERTLPYSNAATIAPTLWAQTAVYDGFGSYEVAEDVQLDFSVENILDRYYIDPLGVGRNPAPGRTARAGFSAKF
jgi:hemoglobin/transferrin/lactoferrin receptor protein